MPYSTKQHQAVLHYLQERPEEAFSAADLQDRLRTLGSGVGLATIYRQLDRLEADGLLHKIITEEGTYYQYCLHHDERHGCFLLRCSRCGRISHLDCSHLEELCRHLEEEHGFAVAPRHTILTGLCALCRTEKG